jgi:hydrogenase expression/formation protein HypE
LSPKTITLPYGGGGEETQQLIKGLFYRHFSNPILERGEDSATIEIGSPIATTIDGFTVSPLFFNGGSIGKLAVVGTINDLAMVGARPRYLTLSFVIEEGLSWEVLERVVREIGELCRRLGVEVVAGDTKVVPKGAVDQLFITSAGIGEVVKPGISCRNLKPGDKILVSGEVGRHGAVILAHRYQLETDLTSDCAPVWPQVEALLNGGVTPSAMRDGTRGGVSAVLNEWAESSQVEIEIWEERIPVPDQVVGLCELFGFDPLDLANEGTFLVAVPPGEAERALEILREFNRNAAIIGEVTGPGGRVKLKTPWGTTRYLELPKGELLPRIC